MSVREDGAILTPRSNSRVKRLDELRFCAEKLLADNVLLRLMPEHVFTW